MEPWAGFWIALGIVFIAEEYIDYLKWRTKIEYGVKKNRKPWYKKIW